MRLDIVTTSGRNRYSLNADVTSWLFDPSSVAPSGNG